ncbi:uncharacterized protein KY384_008906 [Bacidia gigantensis]|uniref:uncharacterized protein n=1 Tax=Bacidia gigantensis TaxID=2732470 RepID=UPI001D04E72A|nr:uncharacterized protein KY384_008906 [Bacidia gigantensis]KAG8525262.1 hypothetical protein KY384_008906 [Bacidia gigantensis]
MDILADFETMATDAADSNDLEPPNKKVSRWQTLFLYTCSEALKQTKAQHNYYARTRVSDEHWEASRQTRKLKASRETLRAESKAPSSTENASCLLLLTGILNSPEAIQNAAGLQQAPTFIHGSSESDARDIFFVEMLARVEHRLEN